MPGNHKQETAGFVDAIDIDLLNKDKKSILQDIFGGAGVPRQAADERRDFPCMLRIRLLKNAVAQLIVAVFDTDAVRLKHRTASRNTMSGPAQSFMYALKGCLLLILVLARAPLLAEAGDLVPGAAYDFYCADGQHMINATLVEEGADAFTIRLPNIPENIRLERTLLMRPPVPHPAASEKKKEWFVFATAGAATPLGDLSAFSAVMPAVSLHATGRLTRPFLIFSGLWRADLGYGFVSNAPRRVDLVTFAAGPQWSMVYLGSLELHAAAMPAMTALRYTSFTFAATDYTLGLRLVAGATWMLRDRWFALAEVVMHYIYDASVPTVLPGIALGAGYRW